MNTFEKAPSDFAGFIDGFQASNLDAIQRNIALQLSEMHTRLSVINDKVASIKEIQPDFLKIDQTFRDSTTTIVERLVSIGGLITELLIRQGAFLKGKPEVFSQIVKLIRVYIDAAEISRNSMAACLCSPTERMVLAGRRSMAQNKLNAGKCS